MMSLRPLACAGVAAAFAAAVVVGARPPQPSQPQNPPGTPPAPAFEPQDVAPYELEVAAYRLDGLVIVVAKGKNRSSGYTTRLELGKPDAEPPEVVLRNIPPAPGDAVAQMIRPFDVTGYFEPGGDTEAVSIRVAGKTMQVQVKPIREIPKGKGEGAQGPRQEPSPPR